MMVCCRAPSHKRYDKSGDSSRELSARHVSFNSHLLLREFASERSEVFVWGCFFKNWQGRGHSNRECDYVCMRRSRKHSWGPRKYSRRLIFAWANREVATCFNTRNRDSAILFDYGEYPAVDWSVIPYLESCGWKSLFKHSLPLPCRNALITMFR